MMQISLIIIKKDVNKNILMPFWHLMTDSNGPYMPFLHLV
jgi:hypothetical protein